jgi:hypothetical protein
MEPIRIDGVTYEVRTVASEDIMSGGFYYELTRRFRMGQRDLMKRLEAEGSDNDYGLIGEGSELVHGLVSRLAVGYQQELLGHYTDMPEDAVRRLSLPLLDKIANYIETGQMEERKTEVSQGGGEAPKNAPAGPPPLDQERPAQPL